MTRTRDRVWILALIVIVGAATLSGGADKRAQGRGTPIADPLAASISGRVTDATGQPVDKLLVSTMWPSVRTTHRAMPFRSSTQTDSDGRYRLSMPPGESLLCAGELFYPNTRALADATALNLAPGEQRVVDFVLPAPETTTVSGRAILPRGASTGGVRVRLVNLGPGLDTYRAGEVTIGDGGPFSFAGIQPGQYGVFASGASNAEDRQRFYGMTRLTVGTSPVGDLAVTLEPGARLSGRVVAEGLARTSSVTWANRDGVGSVAFETDPWARAAGGSRVDLFSREVAADGSFSIDGVPPGHSTVSAASPGSGSSLVTKSVTWHGRETLDNPLDFKSGDDIRDILVTVTDRVSKLSGVVESAAGLGPRNTVVVFSADARYWFDGSRRIKDSQPDSQGRFSFSRLPAGDYFVAALGDVEPQSWFDPPVLQAIRAQATRITLGEGEQRTLTLRR